MCTALLQKEDKFMWKWNNSVYVLFYIFFVFFEIKKVKNQPAKSFQKKISIINIFATQNK